MDHLFTDVRVARDEPLSFALEELEQRLETAALTAGIEAPQGYVCCECTFQGGCPNVE